MRKETFAQLAEKLDSLWADVLKADRDKALAPLLPTSLVEQIFKSSTRSYAYALITQLLAKYDDPERDARCIQKAKGSDDPARFDARSMCSHVVVPWERSIGSPLGLSTDPYVNNSLRVSDFSPENRGAQRQKEDWDALVQLLELVQRHPNLAGPILSKCLLIVRQLREDQQVEYPTPQRASLGDCLKAVDRFLQTPSGGARLQLLGFAVFDALRLTWNVFDEVLTSPVNVSDKSSGKAADVVCRKNGQVVIACEVKDRELNLEVLDAVINNARLEKVRELFTLVRGKDLSHEESISGRIDREFKHGMNVYLLDCDGFFALVLALIGEPGRQHFLRSVIDGMTHMNLGYDTRREWSRILAEF